jgi:hypothetical protein
MDSSVVVTLREFLLGRTQRVRELWQLWKEVRVATRKCSWSTAVPRVRKCSRNIESTIRLFADGCIIYRNILNNNDMGKLQIDLNRLGEWA